MTEEGEPSECVSPTSGLVEQQCWCKKFQQSLATTSEAELLTKLDAGIESLDAKRGIPASEAFAALRSQSRNF
jgi:hypothetical protein